MKFNFQQNKNNISIVTRPRCFCLPFLPFSLFLTPKKIFYKRFITTIMTLYILVSKLGESISCPYKFLINNMIINIIFYIPLNKTLHLSCSSSHSSLDLEFGFLILFIFVLASIIQTSQMRPNQELWSMSL